MKKQNTKEGFRNSEHGDRFEGEANTSTGGKGDSREEQGGGKGRSDSHLTEGERSSRFPIESDIPTSHR